LILGHVAKHLAAVLGDLRHLAAMHAFEVGELLRIGRNTAWTTTGTATWTSGRGLISDQANLVAPALLLDERAELLRFLRRHVLGVRDDAATFADHALDLRARLLRGGDRLELLVVPRLAVAVDEVARALAGPLDRSLERSLLFQRDRILCFLERFSP